MPTVVAPTIYTSTKAVMSSVMGVWGATTPALPTVYGYNFAASGDYFSTPDSVANSITGDISFVVDCALDDWTPATTNTLLSKDGVSATTRSYAFNIQPTTGYPRLNFSTDGTTIISVTADAAPTVADGGRIIVGVQREASTGQVKFYTTTDRVTWTQLGTTQTGATGAIYDSTTQVHFGSLTSTSLSLAGKIYDSEIYSGLYFTGSATLKVDFDPADWTTGYTWTSTDTGEVWTINGNALLSSFTAPMTISGLRLWLDANAASTITQSGGAVSQWNDKSRNGFNFTQATGSMQPLTSADSMNGKNVIKFDGTDDSLSCNTAGLMTLGQSANTLIVVYKFNAIPTGTGMRLVTGTPDGGSTRFGVLWYGTSSAVGGLNNTSFTFVSSGISGANTSPSKLIHSYDGATTLSETYNNNTAGTGAGAATALLTNMLLGCVASGAGGAESLNGSIAEIIAYNKALSAGELTSINSYLSSKWGV